MSDRNNDDLGGSWLDETGPTADNELTGYLRHSIPAPAAGYWDAIDASLGQVERDQCHSDASDTGEGPGRLMVMDNEHLPKNKTPLLLVAAALLVIGGIAGGFALNRSSDTSVDLATAPTNTTSPDPTAVPAIGSTDPDAAPTTTTLGADPTPTEAADAPLATGAGEALYHTVVEGDRLSTIADQYGVSVDLLVRANPQMDPSLIISGERLLIPPVGIDPDSIDDTEGDTASGDDVVNAASVLSSAGLGPMRIGMTVSELSAKLDVALTVDSIDVPAAGECGWINNLDVVSDEVWTLVELTSATDGVIRRITVSDPRWRTPSNLSVGATEQEVFETFPTQIEAFAHVYDLNGQYLRFIPNDPNDPNTVQFDTNGSFVTDIHVGDRNWVGFVEGCA